MTQLRIPGKQNIILFCLRVDKDLHQDKIKINNL